MVKRETFNKLAVVCVFAIAMAFLEAVFVIYLRRIFYSGEFGFPADYFIYIIEVIRESATIIMLVCIGLLAGKKTYSKLGYYLYSFAIWDIFYYVFLKATIDWPSSLLTWDTLFLIPIQWVGPVLAPVICSLTMLLLAFLIFSFEDNGRKVYFEVREKVLLGLGCVALLYTFMYDYSNFIIKGGFLSNLQNLLSNQEFKQAIMSYVPVSYNWILFAFGEGLIIIAIILFYSRYRK